MASKRAHLIVGGFPIGSTAGHDMDFARITLLQKLYDGGYQTTVANDFADIGERLHGVNLLVTYVAGPYPNDAQCEEMEQWMADGGRWFALHGTSGGRAARIEGSRRRRMVRLAHHDALGAFFLNHPPLSKFKVEVQADHPITAGLPANFETSDELYLVEPVGTSRTLLTTELPEDPSPPGFGFVYDEDTSVREDGKTRVLGLERTVGKGAVVYVAPWPLPFARNQRPAPGRRKRRRRWQDANGLPRLVGNRSVQHHPRQRSPLGRRRLKIRRSCAKRGVWAFKVRLKAFARRFRQCVGGGPRTGGWSRPWPRSPSRRRRTWGWTPMPSRSRAKLGLRRRARCR